MMDFARRWWDGVGRMTLGMVKVGRVAVVAM